MFYLLWCHYSSATKKKFKLVELFFSTANEVKSCGLVHQLILRMLKDLILLQHDSQLLNGNQGPEKPAILDIEFSWYWDTLPLKNVAGVNRAAMVNVNVVATLFGRRGIKVYSFIVQDQSWTLNCKLSWY